MKRFKRNDEEKTGFLSKIKKNKTKIVGVSLITAGAALVTLFEVLLGSYLTKHLDR